MLLTEVSRTQNREAIEAVQRVQDYIDENIRRPITLNGLARAAGYSPWHTARLFKLYTGIAPFEYIRRLRLSKAALRLRDEKPRVTDVALDFVFDSHEGFTRAFSRQFGVPPKAYSSRPGPIALFIPNDVRAYRPDYKKGDATVKENDKPSFIFTQVVERPARKLLLKRAVTAEDYFTYCDETGCGVWGVLTSVKEAIYEPVGLWLPDRLIPEGTSRYVQGVELPLDYDAGVPEGYELIELPPCKMMVFQGQPYDDEDFCEVIDAIGEAIERFDPAIYGYEWADEEAPMFQLEPLGYRGYIEARPVRALNEK
ncbi:MAG TPA: AraC family transcriptional regulator [Clostridiales bacterium]|nr:MAG: Right origin-binding protein [Firmicutes bacterium ADurb.Bin262]HOU10669.1 AraC family transcriptional regulator [Clostridiales bacterium]HQH63005.1 AraC family transcriptional regulator [Clostridiales bacterium]HQK73799.1 AraC family transcriptional regulator [Clostridiales bacterium]